MTTTQLPLPTEPARPTPQMVHLRLRPAGPGPVSFVDQGVMVPLEGTRPTQTGAKKLCRHDVTCSRCGWSGDMPWVRGRMLEQSICPKCGSVERQR